MASDILTTVRTNVRAALADTGSLFPDAMIDQAIFSAVADISRMAPRQLIHIEVLHTRTITAESFTSAFNTWVDLANYIDEQSSVVVTNNAGSVTYNDGPDDPDYIMDFVQGRIQALSTGDMSDSATHKITYEKSLRSVNLSSLTGIISLDQVQVARRGGQSFSNYSSWHVWGDVLTLEARDGTDSPNLSEGDRVRIFYTAEHTKPGASAGSYPIYMDDVVVKGAIAYALFSQHRARSLAAIVARGDANTQASLADADQSEIDTLETAITTALDAAKTTLGLIDELADTSVADVNTALDAVITHLGTDLEAYFDDALLLGFNTSIEAALDKIIEHLETDSGSPDSAELQLAAGDGLINSVNLGNDAALVYANYSRAQIEIARGFVEEALARVQQKQAYLGEMDRRLAMSDGFIAEARERLGIINALYQTAFGYIQEAAGRQAQIDRHINLGLLYIDQTRVYLEVADRDVAIGDRFLIDAQERHAEYWQHLESRVEMARPNTRQAAPRQNP